MQGLESRPLRPRPIVRTRRKSCRATSDASRVIKEFVKALFVHDICAIGWAGTRTYETSILAWQSEFDGYRFTRP